MKETTFEITARLGLTVQKKDADFALVILNKYLEDHGGYVKTEMYCTDYDDDVNHNRQKVVWAE